ncbi:MAG: hypothetical protein ACI395_02025 [Candidatus Cryptobacteroides sp.]
MRRLFLTFFLLTSMCAWLSARTKEKPEVVPFDRGIGMPNSCFIPKGSIGGGLSVSYTNYNIGNTANDVGYKMLFSLIQDVKGSLDSFGVSPYVSYFVADNISVGARFDYDRSGFSLGGLNLKLTDELEFNINNLNYLKQSYTGALTVRDYIPIAASKRFAMFAELRAAGSYGQAESYKIDDMDKVGTYQDIYNFSLGVVPGITCFVTNETAIEISVGVLGFEYQKVVQTTNQVEVSVMENSKANFKINLLSINLGLSVYIPTGAHRMKKNAKAQISKKDEIY